jgi:DNA-binding NtrC family response regulator
VARILCVDDEPSSVALVQPILTEDGHEVVHVTNVEAAMNVLGRGRVDLVLSDLRMPDAGGLDLLERMGERLAAVPLIIMTGHATIDTAVAAIKAGAADYVTKPLRADRLRLAVDHALDLVRLKRENAGLREEVSRFRVKRELVGESAVFRRLLETVESVAPTRSTVLIEGESGTGKELLARAIHDLSPRHDGPFIAVNCAAMPEHLVESILFGHEKGAFTGAIKQARGAFERADGGTLLLDEISEMRLDLQAKLLRALQEQEFERVGGSTTVHVDVRVIATSNRDLREWVASGDFREDLYYRLSVVPLEVPPLRQRGDDILLLADRFADKHAAELGKRVTGFSPEAAALLQGYPWPGNVRELDHAIERALILADSPVLTPAVLPDRLTGESVETDADPADESTGSDGSPRIVLRTLNVKEVEDELIRRALDITGDNRTRAAELLGMSVRTLRSRLNAPAETDG